MSISSQSRLSIKSKSFFTKVLKLTNLNEDINKKVKSMESFGNKGTFYHNYTLNQKSCLQFLKLTNLNEDMKEKAQIMQSFGQTIHFVTI